VKATNERIDTNYQKRTPNVSKSYTLNCIPHDLYSGWTPRFCHGININDPEDLRALKESISSLNESDKNFEDNSFSVELFVDK
jgi:hypothetical protein